MTQTNNNKKKSGTLKKKLTVETGSRGVRQKNVGSKKALVRVKSYMISRCIARGGQGVTNVKRKKDPTGKGDSGNRSAVVTVGEKGGPSAETGHKRVNLA